MNACPVKHAGFPVHMELKIDGWIVTLSGLLANSMNNPFRQMLVERHQEDAMKLAKEPPG